MLCPSKVMEERKKDTEERQRKQRMSAVRRSHLGPAMWMVQSWAKPREGRRKRVKEESKGAQSAAAFSSKPGAASSINRIFMPFCSHLHSQPFEPSSSREGVKAGRPEHESQGAAGSWLSTALSHLCSTLSSIATSPEATVTSFETNQAYACSSTARVIYLSNS